MRDSHRLEKMREQNEIWILKQKGRRGEWRGKGEGMEREKREREARKRTKGDSPLGGTEKLENTEAGPASPLHNQRYRRERDPSLLTLVGK